MYCWKCSKPRASIHCTTCVQSFHSSCCGEKDDSNYICETCGLHNEDEDSIDEHIALVPVLLGVLWKEQSVKLLKELHFCNTNGKIVNPIDFEDIYRNRSDYGSFDKLKEDILWLNHNCAIVHGSSQCIMNAARKLVKLFDEEIEKLVECSDCYGKKFTAPCKNVHPLVWGQSDGFQFWPGKAMDFKNDKILVRYFGDHSLDFLPLGKCFAYSQEPPEKAPAQTELYEEALDVS